MRIPLIPNRREWQRWSVPSRLTAVGAYVGIAGLLLTVVLYVAGRPATPPELQSACDGGAAAEAATPATAELLALLNMRAAEVVKAFERTQDNAIAAMKGGLGDRRSRPVDVVEGYERARRYFLELHSQNIQALCRGQLALSHEIVRRIHYLLWIRTEWTFWEAFAVPDTDYYRKIRGHNDWGSLYPGELPSPLKGSPMASLWQSRAPEPINRSVVEQVEARLRP